MFCCGCSVRFGVGCIAIAHLAVCCFYVASACSNLIWKVPFLSSSWHPMAQLFFTAFCLVGIPITVMAFLGVMLRREINVRIYLVYLCLTFLIDIGGMVYVCLVEDPCNAVNYIVESLADQSGPKMKTFSGEAFMCGTFRIASYVAVTFVVLVEVYCLYIVWSMCEDIHAGRNGPELSELIPSKDDILKKRLRPPDGPYASIVGFAHCKVPGPYPSAYGTIKTSGMPGQGSIFGGTQHETSYPPRPEDVFS